MACSTSASLKWRPLSCLLIVRREYFMNISSLLSFPACPPSSLHTNLYYGRENEPYFRIVRNYMDSFQFACSSKNTITLLHLFCQYTHSPKKSKTWPTCYGLNVFFRECVFWYYTCMTVIHMLCPQIHSNSCCQIGQAVQYVCQNLIRKLNLIRNC